MNEIAFWSGLGSFLLSLFAVLYSMRIGKRHYDLEHEHKALERKILESQLSAIETAGRANVQPIAEMGGPGRWSYVHLKNEGRGIAHGLTVELRPVGDEGRRFIDDDQLRQFPADLEPQDTVSLRGALSMGCALEYEVIMQWTDSDGTLQKHKRRVGLR